MSLIDTITGWINRDSKKYICASIDSSHVIDNTYDPQPLKAGENYFRLWLCEMCLAKDRECFKSWYPVVNSIVCLQFGDQKVNLPYIAGSLNLPNVDSNHMDSVIQLNHPMTALMPFNGGIVELTAGILSMEGEDYLNQCIKVMGDFANLLVVPQLSAALSVAEPIAKGVEELLGATNGKLRLGLHQAFVGEGGGGSNNLKAKYIAAILAEEEDLDVNNLWVMNDRLRYGISADNSKLLTGNTYMLFRIENRKERDDLEQLRSIREPFDEAMKALMNGEEERANTLLRTSILVAMTSSDLTKADRLRYAKALKAEFDEAKEIMLPTRGEPTYEVSREDVEVLAFNRALQRAIPVNEALALGEPTFEEIFGKP